jgi:hypothetical protein
MLASRQVRRLRVLKRSAGAGAKQEKMLEGPEKVTLFLGNYGSGKTEVAVNYALHIAANASVGTVALADLDLVNPYFRSREPRDLLEAAGVRVILPDRKYHDADLPILVPEVRAALTASTAHVILDVGGDDAGARVLGALTDALPKGSYQALMVLNGNRPFTGDVAGIKRIRSDIERAGRIEIGGLVSNTHLMEETTVETILAGYRLAREAAEATGLPLEFVCAPEAMVPAVTAEVTEWVLPIVRYLAPSWKNPGEGQDNLGKELFRL